MTRSRPILQLHSLKRRAEAVDALAVRLGAPRHRCPFATDADAFRPLVDIGRRLFAASLSTENINASAFAHGWLHGSGAFEHALGVDLSYASLDFPSLLLDAFEKVVSEVSRASVGESRKWCRQELADRLEPRDVVLDAPAGLQSVAPGEESVMVGGMADGLVEVDIVSYRARVAITFEALVNDDTQTLMRVAQAWGTSAGAIDDAAVVTLLTSSPLVYDGAALFSTAHGNLTTGTVSSTNISLARQKLAAQTNRAGERLNTRAKFLVVPTTLADVAGAIVSDTAGTGAELQLIIMPELDANSLTKWYLVGNELGPRPITLWNVRGREGVTIQNGRKLDADSVIVAARYMAGYSVADYRGIVCSSGV